ncbi:hypothetical protein BN79_078 [Yersinia phage phiR2-01]|uniref:Phage protein n=1 Tax=Yersinia phage phiR2-01 TaxID=1206557 RepID=I7K2M9_9CAUD|nr:hypothetical protein BN79_078 [Yersinia phage phiR2-01]CCI88491.1 hypothetical protein BN79_078 [Yersinia phage phiR2-01]
MANKEILVQRLMLKGFIAEAEIEDEVEDFRAQFQMIINQAKELGDKEHSAVIMAMTLIGLDLADESGV